MAADPVGGEVIDIPASMRRMDPSPPTRNLIVNKELSNQPGHVAHQLEWFLCQNKHLLGELGELEIGEIGEENGPGRPLGELIQVMGVGTRLPQDDRIPWLAPIQKEGIGFQQMMINGWMIFKYPKHRREIVVGVFPRLPIPGNKSGVRPDGFHLNKVHGVASHITFQDLTPGEDTLNLCPGRDTQNIEHGENVLDGLGDFLVTVQDNTVWFSSGLNQYEWGSIAVVRGEGDSAGNSANLSGEITLNIIKTYDDLFLVVPGTKIPTFAEIILDNGDLFILGDHMTLPSHRGGFE